VRRTRIEISYLRRFHERTNVLFTIVNDLETSNDLNIEPDVASRVLLTSTLEPFTVGHTILCLSCMIPSYRLGTSSRTSPRRAYGFGPRRLFPYLRLTVDVDYCMSPLPGWGHRWAVAPSWCSRVRRSASGKNFARSGVAASRPKLKLARAAGTKCVGGAKMLLRMSPCTRTELEPPLEAILRGAPRQRT
jgi:hypothetical protein